MEQTKRSAYGWGVKLAVLLLMFGHYSNSAMAPISGVLRAAFPEQLSLVKIAVQINYIAGCLPLLLMGPLSARFRTKQISLAGLLLCATGALPVVLPGLGALLVTQFTCGLGIGIMYAYAASYIVNLWEGREANSMMGNRSTVGAICGFLYQQFAGRVAGATGTYRYSLLCLLACVLVFAYDLVKLPGTYPVEQAAREAARRAREEGAPRIRALYPMTWLACVFAVLILMFAQTMMMDMGIVAMAAPEEGGLGVAASTVSNIMTCFSVSMILSGQLYSRLWCPLFRGYTVAGGVFLCAAGMAILMLSHTLTPLIIGVFVFGFGFQTFNAAILQLVPRTTDRTAAARSISLFWIFSNAGSFLASMAAPSLAKLLFGANVRGDWYVSFGALVVLAVAEIFVCRKINGSLARRAAPEAAE